MEKVEIQELIDSKSDRVSFDDNKGKSAVWKYYKIVKVDKFISSYVKCDRCSSLLKWRSRDGTSGLTSHIDSCAAKLPQQKLTHITGFSSFIRTAKLAAAVKIELTDSIVNMCAKDIMPISIVGGHGFKDFAKKLIKIGATYGKMDDVDDVLPDPTTVSRHLEGVVMKEKQKLIKQLASIEVFGVTTDLWTHTNDGYITVTVQYVDVQGGWHVKSQILSTRVMNERHTVVNVLNCIQDILLEFGASRGGNVYVTDNVSIMEAEFRGKTWLGCTCHNTNLVLSHGLADARRVSDDDEECNGNHGMPVEVTKQIEACKELVTLVKRTNLLNDILDTTLKQCVVTRWNSVLVTLKCFLLNITDIHIISLSDDKTEEKLCRKLLPLLCHINETLVQEIVDVLEPFDIATKCFSTDDRPTVHLVHPTKVQLAKCLTPSSTDSAIISQMKRHLHHQLDEYYSVKPLHYTATLLDPGLKNNHDLLPPTTREMAIEDLRKLVHAATIPAVLQQDIEQHPPSKKVKPEHSFFSNLYTTSPTTTDCSNEIDSYLASADIVRDDLLAYWESKSTTWKKLSQVARCLLGVPAASTSSDRGFSIAGRTVEERQTQLNGDSVDGFV